VSQHCCRVVHPTSSTSSRLLPSRIRAHARVPPDHSSLVACPAAGLQPEPFPGKGKVLAHRVNLYETCRLSGAPPPLPTFSSRPRPAPFLYSLPRLEQCPPATDAFNLPCAKLPPWPRPFPAGVLVSPPSPWPNGDARAPPSDNFFSTSFGVPAPPWREFPLKDGPLP